MKKLLLKDVLEIKTGRDFKHLKNGNVPVYGSGGIMAMVDEYIYDKETILLPRKGTLTNIIYLNGPFWVIDGMYWTLINKNIIYPKYLFCYLSILDLSCKDTGTTIPSMTFDSYYNIPIQVIEYEKQKQIADFYFMLEDKIKLNEKIIQELESMMKKIYSYWFEQFDFPDENNKPYKSSGGKMVWNDELKKEIPYGWEVKKIKDVSLVILGGTPSRKNAEYWTNDINWINSGEVVNFPLTKSKEKISKKALKDSTTSLLPINSTLISITGNIRFTVNAIECCTNQSVIAVLESKYLKKSYLYFSLSSKKSEYEKQMSGAIQKHINKSIVENTYLLIPDKLILDKYYKKTNFIFDKIFLKKFEKDKLEETKNTFLSYSLNF